MNGREALQDLRWNVSMSQDLDYKENNDLCDIIEKDLKLLEIIKKHIVTKNIEYGSDFDSYNKISFIVEALQFKDFTSKSTGHHYTTFRIDNDFEKIKEWLENDK